MKYLQSIDRLKNIDRLIRLGHTGTPTEFASKLHISRSHLYYLLAELKDLGAPISYCKRRKAFHYEKNFEMKIQFTIEFLSNGECIDTFGGGDQKVALGPYFQ